jgi:predicted ATP-grasp superfamily ATP-dependent carboligase
MGDTDQGMAPVVVLGLDRTGLGAVRSLCKPDLRGVPIIGIVYESTWGTGAYTRLCSKKYYLQDFGSPETIEDLIELGRRFSTKPILLITNDRAVMLVSKYRQRLSPYYHLLLPADDVIELLVDKTKFALYAKKNGFSVPRTWVINDRDDLEEALAAIRFPCFLKPRYRNAEWLKKDYPKGFRSRSPEQLMNLYDVLRSTEQHYVLQEWVEGADSELYFCQVLFDENSHCLASFTCRKLRQWPIESGVASMAEPICCSEIEEETIRLFESLQFKGLGAVEFKRDPRDKRYKITEPRVGRLGNLSETATANGVNFPFLTYAYLTNRKATRTTVREPVRWVEEEGDVQSCIYLMRNKKLSLRELSCSYAGPKRFALFSWRDPLPLVMTILKDLRGNERKSLASSIRGGERERKRSTVAETIDLDLFK